ncbi:SGNH/GDSL hydrolase family protein [Parabacteroides bouchesdurhonensis]|uniref:SGNH/GDSL hydrolase family protein n=1 Tax=Parabacteroides bouchesdurhonensis TaxID=1936995 RepID=UPI000C82002D|nr:GDSL-type esterase/lipase family protein [Parabacteroides bouchesdurhonensis]
MKHTIYILLILLQIIPSSLFGQNHTEVINRGIPGNTSAQLLSRIQKDVIDEQPDLVIILVGTNDLLNTQKIVPIETFHRNIETLADTLLKHQIQVVLVSPPTADVVYLYQRHDSTKFDLPPSQKLELGRDVMKQISKEKNLPFVDLLNFLQCLNIPQHNTDDIIRNITNSNAADGVHFTKKGNELLAYYIYCHLLACYDFSKIKKIVCFGDSITNSVYMEGAGTSEGNTYPAILKRLINNRLSGSQ